MRLFATVIACLYLLYGLAWGVLVTGALAGMLHSTIFGIDLVGFIRNVPLVSILVFYLTLSLLIIAVVRILQWEPGMTYLFGLALGCHLLVWLSISSQAIYSGQLGPYVFVAAFCALYALWISEKKMTSR